MASDDEEFPSVVNFFDVYIKKSPAYKELEKRLTKVEKWIANEERYRKRKARFDEIMEQDPKYSYKTFLERHSDLSAEVRAKRDAVINQVFDEEEKEGQRK